MPRAAALLILLVLSATPAFPQNGAQAPPSARPRWAAGETGARPGGTTTMPDPFAGWANSLYRVRPDTIPVPDSLSADSSSSPRGRKSSWTAVGLSAVLPGAGQVYTENYWKVPVILGLGGYWVYEWGQNNDKYRQYRDLYNQSIEDSPPYGNDQYLALREAYKDQRDSFAWYLGILYVLNIVDAYVGAELYDFDVGPDLGAGGAGAHATLRIHL